MRKNIAVVFYISWQHFIVDEVTSFEASGFITLQADLKCTKLVHGKFISDAVYVFYGCWLKSELPKDLVKQLG